MRQIFFRGHPSIDKLITTLGRIGLAGDLKLCLDAGDADSYTSGQSWLDRSGNGADFYLGTNDSVTAADPTFTGTAGGLSSGEYFAFDAGEYLTRAAANDAWINNLHKNNVKGGGAAWVWLGSAAACGLFGTNGGNAAQVGFAWLFEATPRHTLYVLNGSGTAALNQNFAGGLTTGAWQFVAFSIDEAVGANGITFLVNGTVGTRTSTYSSPSASDATYTAQIGARGNNSSPLVADSRVAMFCMWESVAPTAPQLLSLYNATRGRFGV